MDFTPETAAHVRHENLGTNGVRVIGGTNWDISRAARVTPLAVVQSLPVAAEAEPCDPPVTHTSIYRPEHRMPAPTPLLVLHFAKNSSVLASPDLHALAAVSKSQKITVGGHAAPDEVAPAKLAKKRADTVYSYLKKRGYNVAAPRAFGATIPVDGGSSGASETFRVDIVAAVTK